jgi:hypothetical protein
MNTPDYFHFISTAFTLMYLYFFVPVTMIFASYILIAYTQSLISDNVKREIKFRRGIAALFPFLASLYTVILSEIYQVPMNINIPYYLFLVLGLLIGYLFIYWISSIPEDNELSTTLSCMVASAIFFAFTTIFVVTQSFEIISFVFGLLFGISIYVIRYGIDNLQSFKFLSWGFLVSRFKKFKKTEDEEEAAFKQVYPE